MSNVKESQFIDEPAHPDKWYNFILTEKAQNFIIGLIILNAITLGLATSSYMTENFGFLLEAFENIALIIYTIELTLKFLALRSKFFTNSWNLFDLLIVGIAYIPAIGPLAVLRSLRVLRVMRLISAVPRLRTIIRSLMLSLPSIGWITTLLFMVFYIFAVMATHLFGSAFPEWFGSLSASYYTLFQILTLESWSMGIVRPVMEIYSYAWLFFVPFILLTSFVVLNVFIAVIVGAMGDVRSEEKMQTANDELLDKNDDPSQILQREILLLQEHLLRLEALQKIIDENK